MPAKTVQRLWTVLAGIMGLFLRIFRVYWHFVLLCQCCMSVCPSVCDVEYRAWSYRLSYFEGNYTDNLATVFALGASPYHDRLSSLTEHRQIFGQLNAQKNVVLLVCSLHTYRRVPCGCTWSYAVSRNSLQYVGLLKLAAVNCCSVRGLL